MTSAGEEATAVASAAALSLEDTVSSCLCAYCMLVKNLCNPVELARTNMTTLCSSLHRMCILLHHSNFGQDRLVLLELGRNSVLLPRLVLNCVQPVSNGCINGVM